jgi:putative salt-induced outer membrane protein
MRIAHATAGLVATVTIAALAFAQDAKPKTAFTGDLGFVSATGNTNLTTLSIGEKITRTDGRWVFTQLAAYVYGETNSKESANQLRLGARADVAWTPRAGGFIGATFERNTFAGYNRRTDEFLGALWRALVEKEDSLSLEAGGVLTQQSNVDGTDEDYPAARLGANYKHAFTRAAYFQQLAEYVPNLKTSGAYRANTESALVAPISAHIGIKVGYVIRYDSRPPAKFGTTDRVLTTGVQLSW